MEEAALQARGHLQLGIDFLRNRGVVLRRWIR